MGSALKDIGTSSRFHEATGAIMELARQIIGDRTFFVSYIDDERFSILRVVNAGDLQIVECEVPLTGTY